mgnify:CR=1 FL=1
MRLLVVVPLFHKYTRSLESIFNQDVPCPVDYLTIANDDPHTDGTLQGNYRNIVRKYNRARELFLACDYDAFICMEDDIILPPNAIKRLLACESDVAYGLVCWRHGADKPWSARLPDPTQPLGRVLSETPEKARALWGQVVDVVGVGQACTLIRRRVLEQLEFRLEPDAVECCDWHFAKDCVTHGFTQRADLGLICGHITPHPTPRIVWPDKDEKRLWRVSRL